MLLEVLGVTAYPHFSQLLEDAMCNSDSAISRQHLSRPLPRCPAQTQAAWESISDQGHSLTQTDKVPAALPASPQNKGKKGGALFSIPCSH